MCVCEREREGILYSSSDIWFEVAHNVYGVVYLSLGVFMNQISKVLDKQADDQGYTKSN